MFGSAAFVSSANPSTATSTRSAYDEYVTSLLGNSYFNKVQITCTSSQNMIPREVRDYFNSLVRILKSSYSIVAETDMNIMTNYLDTDTRKLICDTLQNLNIIHVKNICTTSSVFGLFGPRQNYHDAYLICSKTSGFLPQFPDDSVQFSTYDMKYKSYTQINLIKKSDLEKNDYSFDFTKYYNDNVVKPVTKPVETKPVEIKRQSDGVTKSKNRSEKTKYIPLEKTFVFPTGFY